MAGSSHFEPSRQTQPQLAADGAGANGVAETIAASLPSFLASASAVTPNPSSSASAPQIAVANQSSSAPAIDTLSLDGQSGLPSFAADALPTPSAKDVSVPSQSTRPDELSQIAPSKQSANLTGISSSPELAADPTHSSQFSVHVPAPAVRVETPPALLNLVAPLLGSPTSNITADVPELPPAAPTLGEHTEAQAKPASKPALPTLTTLDSPLREAAGVTPSAIPDTIASALAQLNNISSTDSQPSNSSSQAGFVISSNATGTIANAGAPATAVVAESAGPGNTSISAPASARNAGSTPPVQASAAPVTGADPAQPHQSSTANGQSAPIPPISPTFSANNNGANTPVQIAVSANSVLAHKPDTPTPTNSADPRPAARPPVELPPTLPGGPVQTAQLLQRAGQSEMRIGLSTSAFGNVEVHTVVHANEIGVSIGSEKGDLRSLLTNDLPAISSALQQQNVRLHHVDFQNSSTLSNGPGGNGQQSRSFTRAPVHLADLDNAIRPGDGFDPIEGAVQGLNTGLNILA
jgi:hypothetical protein